MNQMKYGFVVLASLFVGVGHANGEVTFDWVTVGNPGNAGDTEVMWDGTTGYGSVPYTYRISKYEVTAGQYTEFLNAVAGSDPYFLYCPRMWTGPYGCKIQQSGSDGSYTYSVAADCENRPVNYIKFIDAMRFVNWLENGQGNGDTESGVYTISDGVSEIRNPNATYFIPSEDEWYKAAYYDPDTGTYFNYPTGNNSPPGYVDNNGNLSGTGTTFVEGGTDPGNYATYDGDGAPYGIGSPYWRTEVGEWENSESPYGTFDQGGNVWEWNEAVLEEWLGLYRGLRGGSFIKFLDIDYLHATCRYVYDYPTPGVGNIGFRVASIPEPASLVLLACMAVAVVMFRRFGK